MSGREYKTLEGNEAVASVAYRLNEVIVIYPITPSSPMGEYADAWMSEGKPNLWGQVPVVYEMQSEAGAAGAVHGALQAGSLATTFTASQGLLLMIPNMYKIAGELTPAVFHIAARSLAAQALSIFGDHSDVMAARSTGWAMLCSGSVQEAMDFALISQAATFESRIPFLHFFDGFRTSHEVSKVEMLADEDLRAVLDERGVQDHRSRALTPDHPVLRGTAQNPDVYFQARETVNSFYAACPDITQKVMDRFARRADRSYRLYEYHGAPDADRVIVLMGSGAETAHETVDYLMNQGEKVGVLKVRLYRPFDARRFVEALPSSAKAIAVLDRTKEPGALGEPLYLDTVAALHEVRSGGALPRVVGGRYGLSSKEFTPAMIKAVFENLAQESPKNHFTVGIQDDLTHTSLSYDPSFMIEPESVTRALFYGLGADGTVSANKSAIKIIGENTDHYAQGYFVYDSKKSGSTTTSHLRFGPEPIRSAYLISRANFISCHQTVFLERYDLLNDIVAGGTFILNTPYGPEEIWDRLPKVYQEHLIRKKLKFYVIDAYQVARESGLGGRINTVMQVCFFALSGVLPREQAIEEIKSSIRKSYAKKGEEIVQLNIQAADSTLAHVKEVPVPAQVTSVLELAPPVSAEAPAFVREVLGLIMSNRGDEIPVSRMPADGTFPTATAQWEKRNITQEIPVWDTAVCIQCNKCVMVCPHGVIRAKVVEPAALFAAPASFKSREAIDRQWKGMMYALQVAPEDCTGCGICVDICPAKNKSETRLKAINMQPQPPLRDSERGNWSYFLTLPEVDRKRIDPFRVNQQQLERPLFEFSGACGGCGETPYLKLMSQLFGDRALIANATGCSSIYGGNLPTTPWAKDAAGRGPAWSNSLFEDASEFGLGFRLSIDHQREFARDLVKKLSGQIGDDLAAAILEAPERSEADLYDQRERVAALKEKLKSLVAPAARVLAERADMLVRKSVWVVGGDGWGYDIGYGGLDHVIASGKDINILLLDTEVYSNTGGQKSKATPRAAVAKYAAGGKEAPKKDLGLIAMTYGNVYVAQVAMGARDEHTLKAFLEAEAYPGPSLIIAYSHCIAHGIDMGKGMQEQKAAVNSGHWLLYRYHPERLARGENPLVVDSKDPTIKLGEFMYQENRFKMLRKSKPEEAKRLLAQAEEDVRRRWHFYQYLASRPVSGDGKAPAA